MIQVNQPFVVLFQNEILATVTVTMQEIEMIQKAMLYDVPTLACKNELEKKGKDFHKHQSSKLIP